MLLAGFGYWHRVGGSKELQTIAKAVFHRTGLSRASCHNKLNEPVNVMKEAQKELCKKKSYVRKRVV